MQRLREPSPSQIVLTAGLSAALATGCGEWQVSSDPVTDGGASGTGGSPPVSEYPTGFHVVGNRIEDSKGNLVVLRGVNRSGTEYKCVENKGIFDGASDEESVRAMTTWNVNAVRVPLNESCWLSISGAPADLSGDNYKAAILDYVALLHRYGLVPILDLHWAAPGNELAAHVPGRGGLRPMPNVDHSIDFWRDVALTFKDDQGVVLEPYNEPFPDLNSDSDVAWQCWRDGCETAQWGTEETYQAAGMQALVHAIRDTGAQHLILLGGIQYSNNVSQWLAHKPDDPLQNLAAAWHVYNFNYCTFDECWNDTAGALAAEFPVVATEIGQSDCMGDSFLSPLMDFLDEHGSGYLAWSWNVLEGACEPRPPRGEGRPWALITDYVSPTPKSAYAQVFRDHMLGVTP